MLRPTASRPLCLAVKPYLGLKTKLLLMSVAGLYMCSALSDQRTGLSFTVAAGPRQRSHSSVRVTQEYWPYFAISHSRLLQPGWTDSRIYIPQKQHTISILSYFTTDGQSVKLIWHIYKPSLYLTGNTLRLCYRVQPVNAVRGKVLLLPQNLPGGTKESYRISEPLKSVPRPVRQTCCYLPVVPLCCGVVKPGPLSERVTTVLGLAHSSPLIHQCPHASHPASALAIGPHFLPILQGETISLAVPATACAVSRRVRVTSLRTKCGVSFQWHLSSSVAKQEELSRVLCSLLEVDRRFGGSCRLHVPPKLQLVFNRLHNNLCENLQSY
jgi:hypothetical protein